MACQGCVGAVKRVLSKVPGMSMYSMHVKDKCPVSYKHPNIPGVEDVDVDLAQQKVVVKGQNLSSDQLVETVAKTGKETKIWS